MKIAMMIKMKMTMKRKMMRKRIPTTDLAKMALYHQCLTIARTMKTPMMTMMMTMTAKTTMKGKNLHKTPSHHSRIMKVTLSGSS